MARKRRELEIFSLSFLDCICCGFGALILLFVLTAGKKSKSEVVVVEEVKENIAELQGSIDEKTSQANKLNEKLGGLVRTNDLLKLSEEDLAKQLDGARKNLALMREKLSSMEVSEKALIGKLEALPTTELKVPVPNPNAVARQYLTDFKLDGENILILVEGSGSMLAETKSAALAELGQPPEVRRNTAKWRRVVKSAGWIVGCLDVSSQYQVVMFNTSAGSLLPNQEHKWLSLKDPATTADILSSLDRFAPHGGANFDQAFAYAAKMRPPPDNIILLTDGLPTASDSVPTLGEVTEDDRVRMFESARRRLPIAVRTNIVLFPFEGDPSAAGLFWLLGGQTGGSFLCPAPTWPDK